MLDAFGRGDAARLDTQYSFTNCLTVNKTSTFGQDGKASIYGNVGIGTAANDTYPLTVIGAASMGNLSCGTVNGVSIGTGAISSSSAVTYTAASHTFNTSGSPAYVASVNGKLYSHSQQIYGTVSVDYGDNSYTKYGPNSTYNGVLYIGSYVSYNPLDNTGMIAVDNGNLHLSCAQNGRDLFLNYYAPLRSVKVFSYITQENGNASYMRFGPNSTYGAYFYTGSTGNTDLNTMTTHAGLVCVSNGNVHIDCKNGNGIYLNWFSTGKGVSRGGGATSFDAGSDERIKSDITLADTALCYENVQKLPLKRFKYNYDVVPSFSSNVDTYVLGWIAQDVQKLNPKSVSISTNHTSNLYTIPEVLEVNKDQVMMTLYGAVQEAIKKIDSLTSNVAALNLIVSGSNV